MIFFLGDFNTCVYLSLMRTHTCTVRICHGQVEDTFSCYDSDDSCVGRRAQYAYLDSELGAAVRRCCLSLGGLSYTSSESSESCSQCTGKCRDRGMHCMWLWIDSAVLWENKEVYVHPLPLPPPPHNITVRLVVCFISVGFVCVWVKRMKYRQQK